ncbi:SGT1 and CS domain-containing protein [Lepidopterella palustris CBS 459.81]|uniref:SGT1 and CS domain-containing protein n=1 Tax=Lepidopterella palustris CBS 459.81 TaxID=1314670 RepID=A0A8E2JBT7_9PEZI|nr:SGT1 and CS domain-containing protein [Lepidopterella palustris CBS 459.81]
MDQASRGAACLANSRFDEAITHYTAAIAANPTAVDYYIKRSTAHQRSTPPDHAAALSDAEIAVALAHKRAKRELIKESQLRRAISLFHTQRYADAKFVFGIVKRLDEKEKTLGIWNKKVEDKLAGLEEGDPKGVVSVKEVPEVQVPSVGPGKAVASASKAEMAKAATVARPVVPTPADKIKQDWYQNSENVYFTLLAKGVPKEKATVEIEENSLSISFPIQDTTTYDYTLDPFYAPVDAENSFFNITSTKIEVTLKKKIAGVKWHSLEGTKAASSTETKKSEVPSHIINPKPPAGHAPYYPTSSKSGPKDWDKVAAELTKVPAKDGEGDGEWKEEDLDAEDGGDETTRFFKKLYEGCDPDQKKAMMKSFSESGGTVLSTSWQDVGSRKVVPEPPDGMEAREYK